VKKRIFEYAILFHPRRKKDEEAGSGDSILAIDVTRILARDEKEVQLIAARAIPEKYLDSLDCVEVAVRPF